MPKILENLTITPENIHDLGELIQVTLDNDERLEDYVTLARVNNGDPIGLIGEMGAVGNAGAGCDPTFKDPTIANQMKRWSLGDWSVPLKICYTDIEGTVGEFALKNGTPIGDITGTMVMSEVIYPALKRALDQMMWRVSFFGDTEAKSVSGGGSLKDGTDATLFTITDGFFKRVFQKAASTPSQLTTIEANAKATWAEQHTAILASGKATGIIDKLLMDADSRITGSGNSVIYMTKALADALTYDLKNKYQVIMPWEAVFDGVKVASYNGYKVASIGIWDRIINSFEGGVSVRNKPFRAIMTTPRNLLVGTPTNGLLSDIDVWFDRKERRTYIYSAGKIGTQILEDTMVHAAY